MKSLLIVASVVILVAHITTRQVDASEGFEDLVKVVKSGADDKALTAYIDASPVAYALTVDEILYLNDLGLSTEMIKAVTEHGKKLAGGVVEPPPPPPPEAVPQPEAEEPPPAVSLPPAEDAVQETVVDAPVVTAPPSDDADVSTFYGALSPYGSWVNVDGAQYWQPTAMVVDSSWSPYCQRGHWVDTDCGWMWQSDYSWGWAPFHYGRWSHHYRYGWIWLPDTEWGPAWVTWRHSDAAIGWAPLPPGTRYEAGVGISFHGMQRKADFEFGLESRHFTFVPVARFNERVLVRSRLPRTEVTRVYNTTTIIQNNYTYNDNHIINRGPSITHIQEVTHQEIKPLRIVDQHTQPGQRIPHDTISGESVAVYRPHVAPTARETPQAVVARRETRMQIKHEEARKAVSVFGHHEGTSVVPSEQERGIISREAAHPGVTPLTTVPPVANKGPVDGRTQIDEAVVAQRRKAEEAAARQREEEQRRTDAFTRQQEQKRSDEVLVQQQEEQRRRGEELARQQEEQRQQAAELARRQEQKRNDEEIARQREEQQRRAEESSRQQAEQQRRAAELARQQEQQRRAEELSRQQADQQRRAEEQARQQEMQRQRAEEQAHQQEEQRRAWQAQRQAEETAARQREQQQQAAQQRAEQAQRQAEQAVAYQREQQQQQVTQQRAQQSAFQGYGNGPMTSQASNRGSASRGNSTNPRNR